LPRIVALENSAMTQIVAAGPLGTVHSSGNVAQPHQVVIAGARKAYTAMKHRFQQIFHLRRQGFIPPLQLVPPVYNPAPPPRPQVLAYHGHVQGGDQDQDDYRMVHPTTHQDVRGVRYSHLAKQVLATVKTAEFVSSNDAQTLTTFGTQLGERVSDLMLAETIDEFQSRAVTTARNIKSGYVNKPRSQGNSSKAEVESDSEPADKTPPPRRPLPVSKYKFRGGAEAAPTSPLEAAKTIVKQPDAQTLEQSVLGVPGALGGQELPADDFAIYLGLHEPVIRSTVRTMRSRSAPTPVLMASSALSSLLIPTELAALRENQGASFRQASSRSEGYRLTELLADMSNYPDARQFKQWSEAAADAVSDVERDLRNING
jgi:hypothetical protein